jgi:hypothetical protein
MDNFKNNWRNESVFGDMIKDCKNVYWSYFTNSLVEFKFWEANEVVYNLTKVAPCLANFQIFTDIPTCIQNLIINEML